MSIGRTEVTLLWRVERLSYRGREKGRCLWSPAFAPDGMKGTLWQFCLWLGGELEVERGFLSLLLFRCPDESGPSSLSVRCQLSVEAEDGSALAHRKFEWTFETGDEYRESNFLRMDESEYRRHFPRDILTVRCTMGRGEGEFRRMPPLCRRTTIGVENISFIHEIEHFSALRPNDKRTMQIPSPLHKGCILTSSIHFTQGSNADGEIILEIASTVWNYVLCKRAVSVLANNNFYFENPVIFNEEDYRFDVERKDIRKRPLSVTRQDILNKKSVYLPDDKLSLLCEYTFHTGREYHREEKVEFDVSMPVTPRTNDKELSKKDENLVESFSGYSSVIEDLKYIYMESCLTDMELKTKTKSFPTHKTVLCARSPVFRRMLSSDMRERNTASIQVDDLEDDVVHRFLLFLYSDSAQDLEWTVASRLYYAADKYEVGRLKEVCSSFLVEHLSSSTAGDLLLLADTHGDGKLKGVVEEYILEHEEEVYVSTEWEMLLKTNSRLAGETMILKYKRKMPMN